MTRDQAQMIIGVILLQLANINRAMGAGFTVAPRQIANLAERYGTDETPIRDVARLMQIKITD